jgi:N-acetylglucosamine kinase-like BadF-type ATPase
MEKIKEELKNIKNIKEIEEIEEEVKKIKNEIIENELINKYKNDIFEATKDGNLIAIKLFVSNGINVNDRKEGISIIEEGKKTKK